MYANQEPNPYQFIAAALYQISAALPGSSRDVPVYISTSIHNRFGKESTASYMEVTESRRSLDLCKP